MRDIALPAALLAVAVVVGGVPGIILGFTAVLLIVDDLVDRIIGSSAVGMADARQAFDRLVRQRRAAGRGGRRAGAGLVHLREDAGWAAVAPRRRLGLQTIPVRSIVGTVEQHKALAFDAAFRPPAWTRDRWAAMYMAAARGALMPPISVYRVGDEHVVRDGHHRVSVLRALGADEVDAHVVELVPPPGVRLVDAHEACAGQARRRRFVPSGRVWRLRAR